MHFSRWRPAALLALLLFLTGGSAWRESATVDEIAHIGAGLSYLQRLDLRLNAEHPPLAKVWAAIPLALRGTKADYRAPSWTESDNFMPAYLTQWPFGDSVVGRWNPWRLVVRWARFPMLLLTLLLGLLVYRYGSQLGGYWGGLLCLALYVSMPAILVFGPLVLTDLPVVLCTLLAVWRFAELWNTPTPGNCFWFGLAQAGALLTKFTGLLLLLVVLLFFLHTRFFPIAVEPLAPAQRKRWRGVRWRAAARGLVYTLAIVYLVYLVLSWNQTNEVLDRIHAGPLTAFLRRLLMPAWLYFRGLVLMLVTGSRSTYLFGTIYPHGVPFYFPVVAFFKSTIGFLLMLVLGGVAWLFARRRPPSAFAPVVAPAYRTHWRALSITFWTFLVICLLSRLDISIRHFLVPLVFLTLLLAPVPNLLGSLRRRRLWLACATAFAIASIGAVVLQYPNLFPYVNALALGHPAYQLMNDSNVTWNGALPAAEAFASQHGLSRVRLDWASAADPALVMPQEQPWDCQAPAAEDASQWAIVSAVDILENHNCGWLLHYPQEAIAGGELYAFRLPNPIPPAGSLLGPPLPERRRLMWGLPVDFRTLILEIERDPSHLHERVQSVMAEFGRRAGQPSPAPATPQTDKH